MAITEKSKVSLAVVWALICAAVVVGMKVGNYVSQSEANAESLDANTKAMLRIDHRLLRMDRRFERMDYRQSRIEQALDLKPIPALTPEPIDDPE